MKYLSLSTATQYVSLIMCERVGVLLSQYLTRPNFKLVEMTSTIFCEVIKIIYLYDYEIIT